MEKQFLVGDLYRGIAIHTKTKTEAERLARLFHSHNLRWVDGDSFFDNPLWDRYENETAYVVAKRKSRRVNISYSDVGYYKSRGKTIIDSTQVVESIETEVEEQKYLITDLRNTAIHTLTEEEAIRLTTLMIEAGISWVTGYKIKMAEHWSGYKENTCYYITQEGELEFSDINYFRSEGIKIIKSSQIIGEIKNKNTNIENVKQSTTMKEQITLFRRGFFVTKNFTPTQCTTEEHEAYTYMATLRCGYQLDEQGFLIDHTLLHKAIVAYIEDKPMLSCEVMSKQLAHLVVDSAKGHGCALKEIDFTIIPVGKGQIQRDGDGNWVAKNPMTIDYNKPANAIYNLIVDENYQSIISDEDRNKYTSTEVQLVTPNNVFKGMRVIKGNDWHRLNQEIEEGEAGVITRIRGGRNQVKVKWDVSGEKDSYYDIGEDKSELAIASDSPNREEYLAANPELVSVDKGNAKAGVRVVKGDGWNSKGVEDGDVGTILNAAGYYPTDEYSDYVKVLWDKAGLTGTSYDIEDEDELALAPEEK